jgi:hypothetical protein
MNIHDLFTGKTRGMMMFAGIGIEPRLGFRIAYLLRNPQLNESLQNPVYGRSRYAGQTVVNGGVNLIGRWMVGPGREILQNSAPLGCQRKPVLAATLFHEFQLRGNEILPALLFFAHFSTLLQKYRIVNFYRFSR